MELINREFNCTYQCFSMQKPLRHRYEIQAVPHHLLDNQYTRLAIALVGPIQFAAYAAMSFDSREHTPSVTCQRYIMGYLMQPRAREEMTKVVYKASSESWYGGYFVLLGYVRRAQWSRAKFLWAALLIPWLVLCLLIDLLCLPLMIVNIVLNEITLLSGNFPVNEAIIAVGQWGPIVGSCLVVIAACINKILELYENQAKTKELESIVDGVTFEHPKSDRGMLDEEQVTGLVKPRLAHVQTLQDMDDLMPGRR